MEAKNHGEVIFYKSQTGIEVDVRLKNESVWLSLNQMATLFGRDKSVISRHVQNVFKTRELEYSSTVAKFATVQKEGNRQILRDIEHFNLDVIIAIGYRVNSKQGTQFRQWATQVLKEHLIQGFTYNEKRLAQKGLATAQEAISLLERTLVQQQLVSDIGVEVLRLISGYAKTWHLLLAYDENKLPLPEGITPSPSVVYEQALSAITSLKKVLHEKGEATAFFGQERNHGLASILHNLEQTFCGQALYPSIEEKAAHLLYFIIKDHPFVDGNKRIGSFLFLLYLEQQHLSNRLNDKGLVALALLIAESEPNQKDILIRLVVNLLQV